MAGKANSYLRPRASAVPMESYRCGHDAGEAHSVVPMADREAASTVERPEYHRAMGCESAR
jgi:hypothetical protein